MFIMYRKPKRRVKMKEINNKELNMMSPWAEYFNQLVAFFKEDDDVRVEYDNEAMVIKIYVDGAAKAEALSKLLPTSKKFGNVEVKVNIIPANPLDTSRIGLFKKAFEGNEAVADIETISDISSNDFNFIIFKPEVVQYYNDDLSDFNGICSTLYQDLAKELFGETEGVYFCTEKIK